MRYLFFILMIGTKSFAGSKLYEFTNYPEIVQEAISQDIHKPSPDFITEVEVASSEVTPQFLAQLKFDNVKYTLNKNGELTTVKLEYKESIDKDRNAYKKTYLHMLGMRVAHYSRSKDCNFNQALKSKENQGFEEKNILFRGNTFWWLNYSASHAQRDGDINQGLEVLSKFCESSEKTLTSFQKGLKKIGYLKYHETLDIPQNPKIITLDELLKHNYFN